MTVKPERNFGLDVLRVIACYMVIQINTGEFYYIGPIGNVLNTTDAYLVGWFNSLCRTCVPLFVMISGFFLFPVNDTGTFFKKRFSRAAIPFILWCLLYVAGPLPVCFHTIALDTNRQPQGYGVLLNTLGRCIQLTLYPFAVSRNMGRSILETYANALLFFRLPGIRSAG